MNNFRQSDIVRIIFMCINLCACVYTTCQKFVIIMIRKKNGKKITETILYKPCECKHSREFTEYNYKNILKS